MFKKFIFFIILSLKSNHQEPILIADPIITSIEIVENFEELIDLKETNDISFGESPEIENNLCYTKIRKSVYEKLLLANKFLKKHDLKICLYEGWRSLELQKKLFDDRYSLVKKTFSNLKTHEEIFKETLKMVSPVVNLDGSINIPPHSTGGAIDVYLIDIKTNNPVDMGIHPKDWMLDTTGEISKTNSSLISKEAKKNRKIMCDILEKVGFVNYPFEYWHFSFGDKYWAYIKGFNFAIYNSI